MLLGVSLGAALERYYFLGVELVLMVEGDCVMDLAVYWLVDLLMHRSLTEFLGILGL